MLGIAAHVYLAKAIEGRNAELIWGKTHDRTIFLVGGKDGSVFEAGPTFPPHPGWEKWGGEMGIGDFGERRDKGGKDNVLVDQEEKQDCRANGNEIDGHCGKMELVKYNVSFRRVNFFILLITRRYSR